MLIGDVCRAKSYGTDHEFVGVLIYGAGGVVGGREGDITGQVLSCSQGI